MITPSYFCFLFISISYFYSKCCFLVYIIPVALCIFFHPNQQLPSSISRLRHTGTHLFKSKQHVPFTSLSKSHLHGDISFNGGVFQIRNGAIVSSALLPKPQWLPLDGWGGVGTAMNPLFGLTVHTVSDLVLLGAPKLNSESCLFGLLGSKKTSC